MPVTLADSISIPEDGMISADVFEELKQKNKAVTFIGESSGVRYEWIIFGNDVKEIKDLNLGIEITESNEKKIAFRFISNENFGFSPALSIYLNDFWDAQSAIMATDDGKDLQITITNKKQSILNFSPEVQTGSYVITPNNKPDGTTLSSTQSSDTTRDISSAVSSETPEISSEPNSKPSQNITSPYETQVHAAESSETNTSDISLESTQTNSYIIKTEQYGASHMSDDKPLSAESDDQKIDTRESYTCTISIECSSILNNLINLDPDKLDVLPKSGVILSEQIVVFYEGESVYDALKRVCDENKIHIEASWTPMYNSVYIEGIGNLYEFDCGSGSGWMYRVNGWYPNYGCSRYKLKQGEKIEWRYSCNFGKDIGGSNDIEK